MPNIKSQKDRVVQSKKEALHNKAIKSNLKTVVKKANAAIAANAADKDAVVKVAVSTIAKAQSKGVVHKNTAARKISRMAKRANKANA
ncbi:MAG TPA: 30S ribosomal protein S20 [Candidatus Fournierella excrementavium]|uniref:Small ribosomal subunit protein bS20 n=2 Tax=Allofournierella TaxID=1940255 RepID=A0A9D2E5R5_9FIRM|nr:30S ribosomal protein S20 [Fournierella sp.]MDY5008646.1 30S ribosomal protein S20 [Candidatus Fournierella merdipullorum]HIX06576.1 30S ribosomal protein S20 [Candidatus Fournierella pullicola]HJB21082.1 30S ribosomal protein S20 [Candidatus Fournierella merdavium]HJB68977.1 30S ribosomal protein S20 [Candidatus Fournierella excrementigallinarum]HJD16730.1 30S ribosomal protein S20 [Candidatus Fournierella excrementavium]